jgi:hypothetical protein
MLVVTRIPQGFDGCSADAACWIAFCRCLLKLRFAVGAAEWMPGDGVGLMVAVGWARLVVLRDRRGKQVLNLWMVPRLNGLWPWQMAAWVPNAAGR